MTLTQSRGELGVDLTPPWTWRAGTATTTHGKLGVDARGGHPSNFAYATEGGTFLGLFLPFPSRPGNGCNSLHPFCGQEWRLTWLNAMQAVSWA